MKLKITIATLAAASEAQAAAPDLTSLITPATNAVASGVAAAMPVAGVLLSVVVAVHIFRKIIRLNEIEPDGRVDLGANGEDQIDAGFHSNTHWPNECEDNRNAESAMEQAMQQDLSAWDHWDQNRDDDDAMIDGYDDRDEETAQPGSDDFRRASGQMNQDEEIEHEMDNISPYTPDEADRIANGDDDEDRRDNTDRSF